MKSEGSRVSLETQLEPWNFVLMSVCVCGCGCVPERARDEWRLLLELQQANNILCNKSITKSIRGGQRFCLFSHCDEKYEAGFVGSDGFAHHVSGCINGLYLKRSVVHPV